LAKPITRLPQTERAGKKLHNGFLWGFLRASEDPIRALNNHAKRFALIGHNPTGTNAWEKYCEIIADHLSKAGWSLGGCVSASRMRALTQARPNPK
jgi:hypothetical protein